MWVILTILLLTTPAWADTTIYRNTNGIIAVERDGVLVFGPQKVKRATDVTVEVQPTSERWIALKSLDTPVTMAKFLTEIGALRVVGLVGGVAFVLPAMDTATEATVRAALAAHMPDKDARQLARESLTEWKTSGAAMNRFVILDLMTALGY